MLASQHGPHGILHQQTVLEAELLRELIGRFRLAKFLHRYPARPVWAVFTFVSGFITIGVLAGLAVLSRTPFVFLSLEPTGFLFFLAPSSPAASPRNALHGHAIGIVCGYGALWLTGLEHAPSAMLEHIHWPRVLAASLSLAVTGAGMILFRVAHPPAGATTLIVSLGIVTEPFHLLTIEVAVANLTLLAIGIHRLASTDYPLWSTKGRETIQLPGEMVNSNGVGGLHSIQEEHRHD
jgi:CBS-domain-containing membrane protein